MIFYVKDKFGHSIRLTEERWNHIIDRHPETKDLLDEIKITVKDPDIIVANQYKNTEKYYHHFFEKLGNYVVVIVEQKKAFIITAYIGRKPKKGIIEWQKD